MRAFVVFALVACACAEVPVDEQCSVDDECKLTEECDWGRCIDRCEGFSRSSAVQVECIVDRDCGCGEVCNEIVAICQPICEELGDGSLLCSCVIDADCEEGTCGGQGFCIAPVGEGEGE